MTMLPPGTHTVRVTQASLVQSQTKGTPGIDIYFANQHGAAHYTGWITINTRDRILENLKVLGLSQTQIDDESTFEKLDTLLNDAECNVVVKEEQFKGELQLKVAWINEASSAPSEDVVASVYGLLTGKATVTPRSAPRPPQPASSGPAPFVDDDSLPF